MVKIIIRHHIKYLIISLFLVIVILWLILNVTSKEYEDKDLLRINEEDENSSYEEIYSNNKWWYLNYDEKLIKDFDWRIILEFYANWCSTCKSFDKSLEDYDLPEDILILKVDFDNSEELRKKYSVLTQSTFVEINNNWDILNRFIAISNINDLIERLK